MQKSFVAALLVVAASNGTAGEQTTMTDSFMKLRFTGSREAELFTRECDESLSAVLAKNCRAGTGPEMEGYISSSVDGRPWSDTMWTRDAGTILREFVHWGAWDQARKTTRYLIRNVGRDKDGYFAFPEYMRPGHVTAGSELDGTGSIIIAMALLWEYLPADDPLRGDIYAFLHGQSSPLLLMTSQLKKKPLLSGSGEFGGGCGIPGEFINVVQNGLVRYSLLAGARVEEQSGDATRANEYRQAAEQVRRNLLKHMVGEDGAWIWTLKPGDMKPDPAVNNHEINKGFGGINGVASMYADVLGLDPLTSPTEDLQAAVRTFDKLYAFPIRNEQFRKYGIWTQFDEYMLGLHMSPSYGHAYALQNMLLFDRLDMAEKAVEYLARATYNPPEGYKLNRQSPYWFYERYYSPESAGKFPWDEGCGALNIVNTAEPLKCARLMVGVDDTNRNELRIIPRIPASWSGYEVQGIPVRTAAGSAMLDLTYRQPAGREPELKVSVRSGARPAKVSARIAGKRREVNLQ